MLAAAYIISFLGMIILPILLWSYFRRKFALSWKLILAGGLTFIASQVLHIPLVFGMNSLLQTLPLLVNAILLGLLAGVFEETARYILFKFILRNSKSWKEGILVGLGHGGIEAVLLGILAAVGFATMIGYRSIDLSTVPGIPADQLEIPGPRSRVFEVGFGSGALLRRFLDDGAVVAGVDPGDLRVDVDPLVARTGTLHSAMLEELPPIEQQDLVVAVHVVEHVADVQGFARACHDMLAPGGCVVLVTPAGDSLSLAIFRASWWMLEDPTHVRFLTARSATRLLEDAGLADVQVRRLVLDSLGAGTASCVRRLRRRTPLPEGVLSSGVTRVLVLACAPAVVLLRLLVPGLRPVMEVTARRPDRTR